MKVSGAPSVLVGAALFGVASAHTREWSLWVDGADQGAGAGKYIRQPPTNNPVKQLSSNDVFCNVGGTSAVSSSLSVPAGATLTSEWYHDYRGDDIIEASHLGPIVAYLAPSGVTAGQAAWTKIFQDGYDGSNWAITKFKSNGGKVQFKLPANLAPGNYLLRVEILALHESDTLYSQNPLRGIQLYPSCNQITVTGSGSVALPSSGAAFPGEYTESTPGILFNLYEGDPNSYTVPGPAVWTGASFDSDAAPSTEAKRDGKFGRLL